VGLAAWAGGWPFLAFVLVVAILAAYEFTRLMRSGGHQTSLFFTLAGVVLCLADVALPEVNPLRYGLAWWLIGSAVWYVVRCADPARFSPGRSGTPTVDWALTLGGSLYIGWLLSHFVLLRALPAGLAWLALALLTTWASDSGAFFLGRAIGRHKLCPQLSPGKTWEGLAGGIIGGLLAGAVVGTLAMHWAGVIGPVLGLLVGLLVAIVAPPGDLVVSMMKREVGAKDSGTLIPGHGGVLDRIDSLLPVVAIVYYVAVWVGR
jgi:phosphatidate cytidylyltransferase